jgi:hypothetical protein
MHRCRNPAYHRPRPVWSTSHGECQTHVSIGSGVCPLQRAWLTLRGRRRPRPQQVDTCTGTHVSTRTCVWRRCVVVVYVCRCVCVCVCVCVAVDNDDQGIATDSVSDSGTQHQQPHQHHQHQRNQHQQPTTTHTPPTATTTPIHTEWSS